MRFVGKVAAAFLTVAALFGSSYAVMDIPNTQPKVDAEFWNKVLDKTWDGIKKRNIAPYENGVGAGLVHRPKSEYPGDAVSESVGYGMIVSLYANDQETFNKIWSAANKHMWNGKYYDWQLLPDGKMNYGAATDAEEDVILMLLFAQKLVDAGKWQPYTDNGRGYLDHAKTMMNSMWATQQITGMGTLAPGAGWGGEDFVNAGYFSPAWYKIFAKYDSSHDWNKVVDRSYEIIANSPAYALGMVPDWMSPSGQIGMSLGYNAYFKGSAFFKDAIRILWRVAVDAIWFDDERAKKFLENSMKFINEKGGAAAADFFQLDGNLLPEEDVWTDMMGGTITRHRREHSPLTIGMWSTAAMAVGTDDDKKSFSLEMAKFYDKDADYFGLAVDNSGLEEDTLHNEMYFEQFLGWFSTSLMTGVFSNIIDDIDNPKTATAGLVTELSMGKDPAEDGIAPAEAAARFHVVRNGKSVQFVSDVESRYTVYRTDGRVVTTLHGKSVIYDAEQAGFYMVKKTDVLGKTQVKHFIIQ